MNDLIYITAVGAAYLLAVLVAAASFMAWWPLMLYSWNYWFGG